MTKSQGLRAELRDILCGLRDAVRWTLRRPGYLWARLGLVVAFIVLWTALGGVLPRGFFATPAETVRAFFTMLNDPNRLYTAAVGDTIAVYLCGLVLAALIGVPLGLTFGAIRSLGRTADPFLNALAATPLIALMPMMILVLGIGWPAKIWIICLGAVMPVIINSYAGLKSVDPRYQDMARAYGLSRWRVWRHILAPQAFHAIMAGLRLGAATGLVTAVFADLYMSMTGLGSLLAVYGNSFRMGAYFVTVLTLAALGVATTGGLALIERAATRAPRTAPTPQASERAHKESL